ncbi:MAG: hypothetical protein R2752_05720 [Vicinamibacterales bacterium]
MANDRTRAKRDTSGQEGDILGISHSTGRIPRAWSEPGEHARGIEVHRHQHTRDDPMTTTDEGAAGSGTTIDQED